MRTTLSVTLTIAALLGVVGAWPAIAAELPAGVRVTYLANEGFLLEAGETKVLVDALSGAGLRGYPVVPEEIRRELESASGRFAGVDVVLASHEHGDHFDPAAVARHLRANPEAVFISTPEAVAALTAELGADARDILAPYPAEGLRADVELRGARVQVLNLHHGRRGIPTQNLGFVIHLGGLELLHVGDTLADAADLEPHRELLDAIDVAFVPDWLLGQPRWQEIGRRNLIVMHVASPDAPASWGRDTRLAEIRKTLPDAWIPLVPLASRLYPPVPE